MYSIQYIAVFNFFQSIGYVMCYGDEWKLLPGRGRMRQRLLDVWITRYSLLMWALGMIEAEFIERHCERDEEILAWALAFVSSRGERWGLDGEDIVAGFTVHISLLVL